MKRLWALVLILLCTNTFAAAPTGEWWNSNYGYRQRISIPVGASALSTQYSLSLRINHAALVSAGQSRADGNDIRIVHWNGSAWSEVDRIVDPNSAWNLSTTEIWFRTAAQINSGTDDNYYVYYGDSGAINPPANTANIFLLYDPFSTALDTSRWTTAGTTTPTTSGGVLTMPVGSRLYSDASFSTATIWETSVRMPDLLPGGGSKYFWFWLASANNSYNTTPHMGFYADVSDFYLRARDSSTTQTAITEGNVAEFQQFSFARDSTTSIRYFRGTTQLSNVTTNVSTASLPIQLYNDANGSRVMQYDWMRVRRYRNPEPTTSLAAAEELASAIPTPVGEWRFEQASWNGSNNEVVNSASNSLHGTAYSGPTTQVTAPTSARAGDPGTCRYGAFNGSNQYVQVAHNSALSLSSQLTISAWIYPRAWPTSDLKSIVSKDTNYEFHIDSNGHIFWWWSSSTLTSTATVPINQWSHVAVTWQSGAQRIYINGVLSGSSSVTGTLPTNTNNFQIGQDQGYAGRYFNGHIDEVRVYSAALSQSLIEYVYNSTHTCPVTTSASHFLIQHDNAGLNCAAETVTVSVRDSANALFTGYTQSMTLNTNTGRGIWSLMSGNGSFNDGTSNDGIATYTWSGTQSSATFALSYPEGQSTFDIDAYQTNNTAFRDNDAEGTMTFSQSGFVVTSSAVGDNLSPPYPTFASPQTAGTSFNVHIAKYGSVAASSTCRIVSDYAGTKSLRAWTVYMNPTVQRTAVSLTSGATTTHVGLSASTLAVDFIGGRAVLAAKFKDVGAITLNFLDQYEASLATPVTTTGSTSTFVVRPATFVLSNIGNGSTTNPGAIDASGSVFIRAGQSFSVDVAARDSEGSNTPSFGLETPAESVKLTSTLMAPSGGASPPVAEANGFGTFASGQASGNFAWSEVGIIRLTPDVKDGDYLGAGNVVGTTSSNVGRFIPNDFSVAANVPSFQTGCASGGFTYSGQAFGYHTLPVVTVTARAVGGGTTTNYRDSFFKLAAGAGLNRTYSSTPTLNTSGLPAMSADPQLTAGQGIGTLSFSSGTGLSFLRTATPTLPFNAAISLYVTILDSDGVAYASNPYRVGGGDIAFTNGAEQRYGRLALRNQVGSELVNLQGVLRSEFFSSNGFVVNTQDTCTSGVTVELSNFTGNLAAGETCVIGSVPSCTGTMAQQFSATPTLGNFNLWFRAPGANNHGSAAVTATSPAWLQFDWDASTPALENPTGRIVFGIFQGVSPNRIYQREDIVR